MKSTHLTILVLSFAIIFVNSIKLSQNEASTLLNKETRANLQSTVKRQSTGPEPQASNGTTYSGSYNSHYGDPNWSNGSNSNNNVSINNVPDNTTQSNSTPINNSNNTSNSSDQNNSSNINNNNNTSNSDSNNTNASNNNSSSNANTTDAPNFEKVVYVKQISAAGKAALEIAESGE